MPHIQYVLNECSYQLDAAFTTFCPQKHLQCEPFLFSCLLSASLSVKSTFRVQEFYYKE